MQYIINNTTSYAAESIITQDKSVVAIVKVTCTFTPDGNVEPAKTQKPIIFGDEHTGSPANSGIKYASDAVPGKKTTDISLVGHAYAPNKTPVKKLSTSLKAGKNHKVVWVTGDRFWKWSPISITKTRPIPFVKMPLVYERAFGGKDFSHKKENKHDSCQENPVGTGFVANKNKKNINDLRLANLENKKNEIKNWYDRPQPACYSPIGVNWLPRTDFVNKDVNDINSAIFNSATPDLISKNFFKGTEPIVLTNLHPEHKHIKFNLPGIKITTAFIYEHETYKPEPELDTLVIEPDDNLFTMVYRSKINKNDELKQINIYG